MWSIREIPEDAVVLTPVACKIQHRASEFRILLHVGVTFHFPDLLS